MDQQRDYVHRPYALPWNYWTFQWACWWYIQDTCPAYKKTFPLDDMKHRLYCHHRPHHDDDNDHHHNNDDDEQTP